MSPRRRRTQARFRIALRDNLELHLFAKTTTPAAIDNLKSFHSALSVLTSIRTVSAKSDNSYKAAHLGCVLSTTRLDNFTAPNKSLTICHAKSPALAENLVADASMLRNTRNQWDVGGAYDAPANGKDECLDPQAWLTQTLERLANGWASSEIDALMPWNYTA